MFDLAISSLLLEAGQEGKEFPGLFAAAAPRKAQRLRAQDQVVLLYSQSGSGLLPAHIQRELLSRLVETYFTTAGSVTTGLRATADRLNEFLLSRNLRNARQGDQVIGQLGAAVIHGSVLYLAHCGPVHTYLLKKSQVEHFNDPSGRGLGQAKLVNLRFFQAALEPGDLIILTPEAPGFWNEEILNGGAQLSPEQLRRRLASQALDVQAGLVRCQPGKGEIHWSETRLAAPASPAPTPSGGPDLVRVTPGVSSAAPDIQSQAAPKEPSPSGAPDASQPAGIYLSGKPLSLAAQEEKSLPPVGEAALEREPARPPTPVETTQAVIATAATPTASAAARPAVPAQKPLPRAPAPQKAAPRLRGPSPLGSSAARGAAKGIAFIRKVGEGISTGTNKLFSRSMPGKPIPSREGGLNLPTSTMLFVALAVPLMVAAVAVTVYFQRGRNEEYQARLQTAQQYASQAAAQQDEAVQREDWNQVLFWLDKAEERGSSDAGNQLRAQAQGALDAMDGIERLAYRLAVPALASEVNVTRMVASINDVYLLDGNSGHVMRLFRTAEGYNLDAAFVCGPGKAGNAIIGGLVDITAMPPNNDHKATVMGVDAGGNLVFCNPDSQTFDSQPLIPPDTNWGKITRMVLFQKQLYVLDPQVNAVYWFGADAGMSFTGSPRLYFDKRIPHMTDVVDLAADQEYLYLLHADGTMTTCTASGFSTECADPAPYGDPRNGRMSEPLKFDDATFVLLQSTQPPDPSLYILDQMAASIYHFSQRRLNLQQQYRPQAKPDYPLPDQPPTAFVITPNRRVMLAFGNQVFYAAVP